MIDPPDSTKPETSATTQVEQWPKIIGATILAFVTLVGSIGAAFQLAGIVNVPLAHIILLVGWLGFVGSFLLLERVLALPRRCMVRTTFQCRIGFCAVYARNGSRDGLLGKQSRPQKHVRHQPRVLLLNLDRAQRFADTPPFAALCYRRDL